MERFEPGTEIVIRDVIFGRPYAVWPQRVIADSGSELVALLRPGTVGVGPALWIQSLRNDDPAAREAFLPALATGECEVGEWTWRRTTWLSFLTAGRYFAISPVWVGERFDCWYVNFQAPYERTAVGVDTSDLHIDLHVDPDLSYRWKDEDEYAHARRLGLVTDACHQKVEEAREQVVAMVQQERGVFAASWDGWAPYHAWLLPELPEEALSAPPAASLQGLPGESTPTIDPSCRRLG
jgi:predicted RNA-binding protein associated with RNAse of E/G family